MSPQLSTEDLAVIAELRRSWRDELDTSIAPLRKQLQTVMQRNSRPPGADLEHTSLGFSPGALSRQLNDDAGFQHWLKSNKMQTSGFAAELRMPSLQRKAAIANISPVEHVGPIYGVPMFPLRLVSLMPVIPVSTGNVEFLEETAFTPNAQVVAETNLKPTTTATYQEKLAKVATVASLLKVSLQALADLPQLSVWLDTRLLYAVLLKQEDVILNGDVTNSISGLMQLATAFAYTPLTTDNAMDVIANAAGALMAQGYSVDGVVMNANDYTHARLLKNSVGSYLFMGTAATGADDESIWESTPLIWQVPMVISPSMPQGQFLVGAFKQSTILFQREVANVQIAFQNEDDFTKNLACLRAELRSGLAVPLPAGLLKGSLPAGSLTAQAAPHNAKK
jgi:HK97 family phage major capsid protein